MRSVADDLRRNTVDRVLAMSVTERIALALSLGDADLTEYVQASGRSAEEARRHLAGRRQDGRTPSRSAAPAR